MHTMEGMREQDRCGALHGSAAPRGAHALEAAGRQIGTVLTHRLLEHEQGSLRPQQGAAMTAIRPQPCVQIFAKRARELSKAQARRPSRCFF